MKSPKLELQRALRHVAARFPQDREPVLTDIALRVFPHSGEVRFYDDETIIISGDLLEDLDKDLDSFLDDLMKD